MKAGRVFSLLLALALQFMPLCRVVTTQLLPNASGAAIVMRWVIGALTLLGACHAVSGASTVITSPLSATGTNGVTFAYRITTGPEVANQYAATPLPPGLTANTTSGRITGTPTASGNWSVLLTASDSGMAGRTVTATLALTILPGVVSPPGITGQPQSQTVPSGTNVSFSVTAGGTGPLRYQWRFGGNPLAGGTNSTLTLASVTTNQSGGYTVVVTNPAGSITSSVATLTVTPPPVAPAITSQPQSQTVIAGTNVSLSVIATGTSPLSYQWRLGGANLSGRTGSSLTLTGVSASQAGNYTVVVGNAAGSITSSVALLTVLVPPSITNQPQNISVTSGATANFSVGATGTSPMSYQWRFNGFPLSGQTSSNLALTAVTSNDAGGYTVVIANSAGSVTSVVAVLAVTAAAVPPSITLQPQSQTITAGNDVAFSINASGTAPLFYQWRLGASLLPGQTGSSLSLTSVGTNQAGNYTVVVTNVAGAVTSSIAILTVNAAIPPSLASQPQSQTVYAGTNVIFSVSASGTAPLSYQWRLGSSPLAGQTNATLSLTSVTTAQSGSYNVIVTNFAGSVTSSVAVLTVNPALVAPAITSQPQSQTNVAAQNVTFAVTATGSPPMSYQWQFNGANLPKQTGSTLLLTSVATNQSGGYRVVASNPVGSVTSIVAQLTITPAPLSLDAKAVAGHYNGLLYDTNGVQLGSAGFFAFTLTRQGSYSASLSLSGGWHLSASGRLDPQGKAMNKIARARASAVLVNWSVDLGGADQVTGTATSASWSAELLGDRALFNARTNPCPNAGKYTFMLPGTPGDPAIPEGDSYGTASVDKNGIVTLRGRLADRAGVTQRAPLSKNSDWPLFVPLYIRTGALIAWVHFADLANDDFHGLLTWMKPGVPTDHYYPNGFTLQSTISGSLYTPPTGSGTPPLLLTNPVVSFTGGDLTGAITNPVSTGAALSMVKAGPDKVNLSFNRATGLFKGSFTPDGAARPSAFGGAVLQKANTGSGWFPGAKQIGRVSLQNGP